MAGRWGMGLGLCLGCLSPGGSLSGGSLSRGVFVQRRSLSRGVFVRETPPWRHPLHGNERAVRRPTGMHSCSNEIIHSSIDLFIFRSSVRTNLSYPFCFKHIKPIYPQHKMSHNNDSCQLHLVLHYLSLLSCLFSVLDFRPVRFELFCSSSGVTLCLHYALKFTVKLLSSEKS